MKRALVGSCPLLSNAKPQILRSLWLGWAGFDDIDACISLVRRWELSRWSTYEGESDQDDLLTGTSAGPMLTALGLRDIVAQNKDGSLKSFTEASETRMWGLAPTDEDIPCPGRSCCCCDGVMMLVLRCRTMFSITACSAYKPVTSS